MCVIIAQPSGTYLSREVAEAAWKRNPDGGGFTYIDPDTEKPVVYKHMRFTDFWGDFERARSQNRDRDFIVHFRIATHGSVCLANVHPFPVDDDTVMAHNGIIHAMPKFDPQGLDRTDSQMFIDFVLSELGGSKWLDTPYVVKMVEDYVGGSKLAFLTSNPALKQNLYILNRQKGEEFRGMWFSNFHGLNEFKPKPKNYNQKVTTKVGAYNPGTPVINKSQGDKDWEKLTKSYKANADRRAREEELQRTFGGSSETATSEWGNDYPMDWALNPTEPGLSVAEIQRRWVVIYEEIETLKENRKEWLSLEGKLGFHPATMNIYCTQCYGPCDTDGWCDCYSLACQLCEKVIADCQCPNPVRVSLDGTEPKEVLPSKISTKVK